MRSLILTVLILAVFVALAFLAVSCAFTPEFPNAASVPGYEFHEGTEPCGHSTAPINPAPWSRGPSAVQDSAQVWGGWWQGSIQSHANNVYGNVYQLDARWNRHGEDAPGTVLMMVGGGNHGWARTAPGWPYAQRLQDELTAAGLRVVNVQFTPRSDIAPTNGWVNISATYADLINRLRLDGVITGKLYAFAGSGGSVMTAATLVAQGVAFDGVVLSGGPFGVQPRSLADFQSNGSHLSELERIMYGDLGGFLAAERPECRWLVRDRAIFPDTDLAVIVGKQDGRYGFIAPEAQLFLALVRGRTEVYLEPDAPHQVLKTLDGFGAVRGVFRAWGW